MSSAKVSSEGSWVEYSNNKDSEEEANGRWSHSGKRKEKESYSSPSTYLLKLGN